MNRGELAWDMAATLMVEPGTYFVRVWMSREEWAWDLGDGEPPAGAALVYAGVLTAPDADPSTEPQQVGRYAADLSGWLVTLKPVP